MTIKCGSCSQCAKCGAGAPARENLRSANGVGGKETAK
jgi:hypothetical protein